MDASDFPGQAFAGNGPREDAIHHEPARGPVGRWWSRLDDGRLQCDLCPRRCRMTPGQRGFCYVRQADDDGVHLTTWGRSSGYAVDPIEKKPLNHFLPGSAVLSFGTVGCNLGCRFCQNWDISKARADMRLQAAAGPEAIARAAVEHGCRSVAFTYNDPVIFAEYALDVAEACRARDVRTVAVTAGYVTEEARGEFFAGMDAANIDLKAFTEDFYAKLCLAHLKPVLETLDFVANQTDTWLEVTTLLIPGRNDSDTEISELVTWFADHLGPDVPLHFTAFHPDFKLRDVSHTPVATVRRARNIAKDAGLRHVYVGNVLDPEGSSTWCPACSALLVERLGYELGAWGLVDGACGRCGASIPGVFEAGPGHTARRPYRIDIEAY